MSDDRNEFFRAWSECTSRLQGGDFVKLVKKTSHFELFMEMFAGLAPVAWEELLNLTSFSPIEELGRQVIAGIDPLDIPVLNSCEVQLQKAIRGWAERYQMSSDLICGVAEQTVNLIAFARMAGISEPATLSLWERPTFLKKEGKTIPGIAKDGGFDQPFASIPLVLQEVIYTWEPLEETKAKFRRRVMDDLEQALDDSLKNLPETPTPKALEINRHWVEWTIELRANGRSVNEVAKLYHVTNPAIDYGQKKIEELFSLTPYIPFDVRKTYK